MAVVYPDPKFLIFKKYIQSDTINKIKHNGTKLIILISVLYQNASTSRILAIQALISSILYQGCFTEVSFATSKGNHIFKMAIFSKFFGDLMTHKIGEYAGKEIKHFFNVLPVTIANILL